MALLTGRAVLVHHLWPLPLALIAALRPRMGERILLVSLLAVAGLATRSWAGGAALVTVALGELVYWGARSRRGAPGEVEQAAVLLVLGGAGCLLGDVLGQVVPGGAMGAALMGLMTALAYPLFLRCLSPLADRRALDRSDAVVLLFAAAVALGGLGGITLGLVSLGVAVAGWWVMVAARWAGASVAAAVGLAAGLVLALTGGGSPLLAAALGLGGLLAGAVRTRSPLAQGVGFAVGDLSLWLASASVLGVESAMVNVAAALLMTALTPAWLWERWSAVTRVATPQAAGTGSRDAALMLTRTLREIAAAGPGGEEPGLVRRLKSMSERTCALCPSVPVCWDREYAATYRGALAGLTRMRAGELFDVKHLPLSLRQRCPRLREVAVGLSYLREVALSDERWQARLGEAHALLERVLESAAAIAAGPDPAAGAAPPPLGYATGVAQLARAGGAISGDTAVVRVLGGDRLLMALADGMGAGVQAASGSALTATLIEALLGIGMDETTVLRVTNALLLRAMEEAFSTLDLAIIQLATGQLQLAKVGAAPTFLRRGNRVEVIRSRSLPMGILREGERSVERRSLRPHDLVVMCSDGVIGPADGLEEEWLRGFLMAAGDGAAAQALAETILGRALERRVEERDDCSVLVARLLPRPGESGAVPFVREWVRAASRT